MMYRPNQDHARVRRARTTLEELTSWAEEEAMRREARLSGRGEADARAFRDAARWRAPSRASATWRRRGDAQGACPRGSPRGFARIVTDIPEPFRPADALYRKFKPYLRACAYVVRVVPGLKLEELRAAHSAAVWREEQNPAWAFEAIAKKRKSETGSRSRRRPPGRRRAARVLRPARSFGTPWNVVGGQRIPAPRRARGDGRSRASAAYVPSRARRGNDAKNASALTAAASVGDRSAEMGSGGTARFVGPGAFGPRSRVGRARRRAARARVASLAAMPRNTRWATEPRQRPRADPGDADAAPEDAARVARAMA